MSTVRRPGTAVLLALALALGGVAVASAPAHAQDRAVDGGTLRWGFKQSFRNYVARQTAALPPIGPAPEGERVLLSEGASFDPDGTPTIPSGQVGSQESRPYLFPATGGAVAGADDLVIETGGKVTYNFPSHYFVVTISNVSVVVDGGEVTIVGDVYQNATEEFGDFPAGEYRADGVTIGTVTDPTVTLGEDTVTVRGAGVTVHPDAAEVLPQNAGEPLDDFEVTATLGAQVWNPKVSVSRTTGLDPETTTIVRVDGSGFDPGANDGAGVDVVFGRFAETWQPSKGAPASARHVIDREHVVPDADGRFEVYLDVRADDSVTGSYGVYVYPPDGIVDASLERRVAVSFASGGGGVPEPGELSLQIAGGAASLGTASVVDGAFLASGSLGTVQVSDTRAGAPAWKVTAQVSTFTSADGSFGGRYLGWQPQVLSGDATAGPLVEPAPAGGGLASVRTLASAARGHAAGTVVLDGTLTLLAPLSTPQGDYRAVLTVTAVS